MAISSVSNNAIYTSPSVLKVSTSKTQTESTQTPANQSTSGDTVKISDEARSRLQSAQTGSKMYTAQSETESSTGSDAAAAGAKGSSAGAGGTTGAASSGSTSNTDEIAKLEKEIRALQQEITALAAKSLTDETAKSALATKQAEMMVLTAELTQLQAQQA